MNMKRLISILPIFPMMFILCGLAFNNVTVLVDTENNHVYEYVTVDDILSDFAKDTDAAKNEYKGGYYIISGKIESVSKNGDTIKVFGTSITNNHIICSCPQNLRSEALTYNTGEMIGVFGKLSVGLIDKEIHINVEKIVSDSGAVKTGAFYLLDGTYVDKNSMSSRTLNNGTVNFRIPAAWKAIEHSIVEDGIGTIEGYQYVLNQLPGNTDTVPESFFVCYFDNAAKLENADDKKETALIEKAIINNISGDGKGDSARNRDVTTYYGAKYNYFIGSYTDMLDAGNNGYHVEYIFQKNGNDGLVMYLYVYKDAKHLSDVMFVTRFLEIASNSVLGN